MERTVRLSDGAETRIEVWGERGPLVVGIHGLGASRRGWARIAEALAGEFRVAAYDQRGHGDASADAPMTLARSVTDLRETVEALGEPVRALLGHSWGGAVAIVAGRTVAAERVAAIDPMLFVRPGVWGRQTLPEYRRMLGQPLEEREAAIRRDFAAFPEVEVEGKLHAVRRVRLAPIAALSDDNAIDAGEWNLLAEVDDYPKPLLLALADVRRSVVLEEDRAQLEERGGPNVRTVVYPDASHSLQRDAFERFLPDLEAFLR